MSVFNSYDTYDFEDDTYIDDQSCANCAYQGSIRCPMTFQNVDRAVMSETERIDDELRTPEEKLAHRKAVHKRRREDGIMRHGEMTWCIYWKKKQTPKRRWGDIYA